MSELRQVKHERLSVLNSTEATIEFVLEPWGDTHPLSPGSTLTVEVIDSDSGTVEVELQSGRIIVCGPYGNVRLLLDGQEIP